MLKRISVFIFISFFLGLQFHALASEVTVKADLEKTSLYVNEENRLTVRVTGAQGNIQAPRLPGISGFDTYYTGRASHITFINNVSTTKIEFSYVLVPQVAGKFTIPSIEVFIGNSRYQTQPITVEVMEGGLHQAPQASRRQPAPSPMQQQPYVTPPARDEDVGAIHSADDNIFIRASVNRDSVYPNEQVLLTYSLYTRYDTRYEGFAEEPEMSGFWIEEFPMERNIQRETVRVNGKRYIKADIRKVGLFPTTAADYTIKPGTIKVSVRQEPQTSGIFDEFFNDSFFSGSGFFSRRENRVLEPESISLKVKPFPEVGRPEDFNGAVGNFKMSSSVDSGSVKQNDPVVMKVVIEGEGNIETLKQPQMLEVSDTFKIYESDTSSELFKTGNVIGGRKTFEIIFIPTSPGEHELPQLSFSFFNPIAEKYQTLTTSRYKVNVAPSEKKFELPTVLSGQDIFKKEIELEGKDIRFIHDSLSQENALERNFVIALGVLNGLLTLIVFWVLWRDRMETIFEKDEALKRRKRAKADAEAGIKKLKKLSNEPKQLTEFFDGIDKVLTKYLSDKFNTSTHGSTRVMIERELLTSLGSEDPLFQNILEVYRICDESRFGGQEHPEELKSEVLKILKQTIVRVEKIKK